MVEAIARLRQAGFTEDFSVAPGGLVRCGACGQLHPAADAVVEETIRIEGMSDPDDEAVVFGLACQRCGTRGVLIAAYGPSASPDEVAVLVALASP